MSWQNDLNYGLAAFSVQLPTRISIDDCASKLADEPARNTAAVVVASAAIFYVAERNINPKVKDIYDALVYCSTCLSVGYGDIFAQTPVGKLIGTLLMSVGPALSGRVLDGKPDRTAVALQQQPLETLQNILLQLRSSQGGE